MSKIKKIAVFTSGGDAPGMNACIRAVVRAGVSYGVDVYGIYRGYQGMIEGEIKLLNSRDVSNIIQKGGTILKSARCKAFMEKEGRSKAAEQLKKHDIDGVIAIGGDGTFTGAKIFQQEHNIPFIGIPGTIDNDLYGTDRTIGYDTALNTVVDAVDKIRDTANSHNRLFFVEVMGRDAGFIALRSGIACGAEAILIPENKTNIDDLLQTLKECKAKKKSSSIVIVAEGDDAGGAIEIAKQVNDRSNDYDTRVTILGHIQRGGSPSCIDRVLASRLGVAAVKALLDGKNKVMVGEVNAKMTFTDFEKSIKHHQKIPADLEELAKVLAQ